MKARLLGCLFIAGLFAPSAWAKDRDAVVGANGEVYVVRYGSYGQLFPNSNPAEAGDQVLALDILRPEAPAERLLVPGTRDTTVESKAALVYEDDSRTVFLIWENKVDAVHSVLTLAAFNGSGWMSPVELTGHDHFAPAADPQIAVTRDSYKKRAADGSFKTKHRTILHLLWEEGSEAGGYTTFYTPVIVEEGVYLGFNPLYNLNQLTPAGGPATSFETPLALIQSPAIQNGGDERTVVAAFASASTRRVFTIAINVLPEDLGRLAEKARSVIIDLGAKYYPGNLRALAEQVKAFLLSQETDFQPEILQAIADKIHSVILSSGSTGLSGLVDATRSVIIDLGARLTEGGGLRTPNGGIKLGEIPRQDTAAPPHLLQFRLVSNRPAPRVGTKELRIFTSENGEDLLIAWTENDRVRYRESLRESWTEYRETRFSDTITRDRAYEILEQRIRDR